MSKANKTEWIRWFNLAAVIVIIELMFTAYIIGSLKMSVADLSMFTISVIGLIFVISIVKKYKSELFLFSALLSFTVIPFLMILNQNAVSDQMAVYGYVWIFAGIALRIIEPLDIEEGKSWANGRIKEVVKQIF